MGKVAVKLLKSVLQDFYAVDVLSAAKLQLIKDNDSLNLTSKRPQCVKAMLDYHVRLTICCLLDECNCKALDKLPTYVSSSPDKMPSIRLYENDMNVFMTMLKILMRSLV